MTHSTRGQEKHDEVRRRGRGLGWLSFALGVVQLAAPGTVRRISGVDDSARSRAVVPVVGARELVHAAGLLTSRRKGAWAWTRVAGDAMDLAALGMALAHRGGHRRRRLVGVTGAVAGITALDLLTAVQATRAARTSSVQEARGVRTGGPVKLTATTTIRKPATDVYAFWRDLENLPTFMAHLEQVRTTGDRTSHWSASAPFGKEVEWDAEITDETPGEKISWRSTGKAAVPNAGAVHFVPAPDGVSTEVHVTLVYEVPGGAIGKAVAKYFGEEPHQQLDDELRRLKQVLETGEVVRSDGAPWGKRARREFPQRPAQPLSESELAKGADA
ncbi:SRPBCC family protein [Actinosynnema sp. NPDC047251]|uniref:Putative cyclase/dehydrase n=1 Tax=Saccharothrix espanaensis (strain ATCC 51144 / DSM 44229 / JCM 9112 / NBRC 15066 / NRRL 15764) TaxID=1179773 RepID=K0K7G9_SACES|nr:SRPBCC family protein [Saccharothrix espanaensis]CCH32558.1 putative cyclase/dehydrase [Saccharothrix espanaensis DSM 44229]